MSEETSTPSKDLGSPTSYKRYYCLGGSALSYLAYFALLIYSKPPITKLPLWLTVLIFIPVYTLVACIGGAVYYARRWYRHNCAKKAQKEKRKREREDRENAKLARRAEANAGNERTKRNPQSSSERNPRSDSIATNNRMPKNVSSKFPTLSILAKACAASASSDADVLWGTEQHEREAGLFVADNSSTANAVSEEWHIINLDSAVEPRAFV